MVPVTKHERYSEPSTGYKVAVGLKMVAMEQNKLGSDVIFSI